MASHSQWELKTRAWWSQDGNSFVGQPPASWGQSWPLLHHLSIAQSNLVMTLPPEWGEQVLGPQTDQPVEENPATPHVKGGGASRHATPCRAQDAERGPTCCCVASLDGA